MSIDVIDWDVRVRREWGKGEVWEWDVRVKFENVVIEWVVRVRGESGVWVSSVRVSEILGW